MDFTASVTIAAAGLTGTGTGQVVNTEAIDLADERFSQLATLPIWASAGAEDLLAPATFAVTRRVEDNMAVARLLVAAATPLTDPAMVILRFAGLTAPAIGALTAADKLVGDHTVRLDDFLNNPMTVRGVLCLDLMAS